MHYILKDHIGSINYVIDTAGIIEEEMNFDAWGNRRNPTSWSYSAIPTNYMFDRGFTLHEHLDDFKLINMNGRVYDPVLARFLSPDPVLQMPEYSQNFNRYSYALNNPLKYTDPSGFVIEGDDELIKITNNSPIKIPDNVFTNGKAARQAAANEELFGKIKTGFAKNDRVKTEHSDVVQGQGNSSIGKTVEKINKANNVTDIAFSTAEQTLKTTRVGANFAYVMSGSSKLANIVSNTIQYAPYVGLFVTVGTGAYLSKTINPATNQPYKSWADTGTDIGVNIATLYIGTKFGGWYGAGAALFYIGVKANVQFQMNNGLNPGNIYIINKE